MACPFIYPDTPETRALVEQAYADLDHDPLALKKLAERLGWPRAAIVNRGKKLGLTREHDSDALDAKAEEVWANHRDESYLWPFERRGNLLEGW